jgi:hypothetical protein
LISLSIINSTLLGLVMELTKEEEAGELKTQQQHTHRLFT